MDRVGAATTPPTADPGPGVVPLLDDDFDRSSIAAVRAAVARCAAVHGSADLAVYNVVLMVNEVMTNAVRHAGGHGRLRVWRHGADLWCSVVDRGPGIPAHRLKHPGHPRPGQLSGHGLWSAKRISDSMEVQTAS